MDAAEFDAFMAELEEEEPYEQDDVKLEEVDSSLEGTMGDVTTTVAHAAYGAAQLQLDELAGAVLKTIPASISTIRKDEWRSTMQKVIDSCLAPARTLVAFVGDTGAGKSSLINAILGDDLMPVSILEACTTCPIEVSYHNEASIFLDIEYLTREEWRKELRLTLKDLERETGETSPEADAALAKIKAVYGIELNPAELTEQTVDELLAHEACSCLGTQFSRQYSGSKELQRESFHFISATDGDQQHVKTLGDKTSAQPSYKLWPLIRIVRIRVKLEVLSTGLVIVDLPGLNDNNAAREAITKNFLRSSQFTCIVGKITRACSNKTIYELLGSRELFSDLRLDGELGKVIMVCSQSDSPLPHDSSGAFSFMTSQEVSQVSGLRDSIQILEVERDGLREEEQNTAARLDELKRQCLRIEQLQATADSQVQSHSLVEPLPDGSPSKRRRIMTQSQASPKLNLALQRNEKEIMHHQNMQMTLLRRRSELTAQVERLEKQVQTVFLLARNARVKGNLRTTLADCQRRMSANEIPVFTVSSQSAVAFRRGAKTTSFDNIEQTEIPALSTHLKLLSEKTRALEAEESRLRVLRITEDVEAFFSSAGQLSLEEKFHISCSLQTDTTTREDLAKLLSAIFEAAERAMSAKLSKTLSTALELAKENATDKRLFLTCNSKYVRHPGTFRAYCRRQGDFKGTDWNALLLEPMWESLADTWLDVFVDDMKAMQESIRECASAWISTRVANLDNVPCGVSEKMAEIVARVGIHQKDRARLALDEALQSAESSVQEKQRKLRLESTGIMEDHLEEAYDEAADMTGKGCVARGKKLLLEKIHAGDASIFKELERAILGGLTEIISSVGSDVTEQVTALVRAFDAAYTDICSGIENLDDVELKARAAFRALAKEVGTKIVTSHVDLHPRAGQTDMEVDPRETAGLLAPDGPKEEV